MSNETTMQTDNSKPTTTTIGMVTPHLLRLPFAPTASPNAGNLRGNRKIKDLPEEYEEQKRKRVNMQGEYVTLNVNHISEIAPYVNRVPEVAAQYGEVPRNLCNVRMTNGTFYFIGLAPEMVCMMIATGEIWTVEQWQITLRDVIRRDEERHPKVGNVLLSYLEGGGEE